MYSIKQKLKFATKLRNKQTPSEKHLGRFLSDRNVVGCLNFEPQKLVTGYIPDFVCEATKLVIEIDGTIHDTSRVAQQDFVKDKHFSRNGYNVMRFTAFEVFQEREKVLERILKHCYPNQTPVYTEDEAMLLAKKINRACYKVIQRKGGQVSSFNIMECARLIRLALKKS